MSSTAAERIATRQRWDDAMARSRRLCTCSFRLLAVSKQTLVSAKRTRVESSTRRAERDDARTDVGVEAEVESEVQSFVVNGIVDGRPAHAHYLDGRLRCSAEVAERADVVVAMGETFDPGDGGPKVVASLDDTATAALLTVMRTFSHVSSVELGLGSPVQDD